MLERIATHVENLDQVLGGGLPANSLNIISGPPGTGKTILAHQIIYGNATPEHPALYLTTVSEPLSKVIRYVQGFTFFDMSKVGKAIFYRDLGQTLQEGDVETVVDQIINLVKEHALSFLVIDGFKAIHDIAPSHRAFQRAFYRLAGTLSALACTTLLLGEYNLEEIYHLAEFAVVDGIIHLSNTLRDLRDFRGLRVLKLRGSGYLSGELAMSISEQGIRVFPRFITPPTPRVYQVSRERCSFGVAGLDELLHGGVRQGTTTLVVGEAGTGKTLLGLSFLLNGVLQGDPGVFVSFQEDPNLLQAIATNLGWDVEAMLASGKLNIFYTSPVELTIDEHALRIIQAVKEIGARRVVVDAISDLRAGAYGEDRYFNYAYSLVQFFKDHHITALLTNELVELFGRIVLSGAGLSYIADNVILLRYVEHDSRIKRAITVLKARGSTHCDEVREFKITPDGVQVGEPFSLPYAPLTGRFITQT